MAPGMGPVKSSIDLQELWIPDDQFFKRFEHDTAFSHLLVVTVAGGLGIGSARTRFWNRHQIPANRRKESSNLVDRKKTNRISSCRNYATA